MKRILVLSTMCSRQYYEKLCAMRTKPTLDTQQKFMTSIVEGLAQQDDVRIDCISVVPISRSNYPESVYKEHSETIDGINYLYVGFRNFPIIKNLTAASAMKAAVKKYYSQHNREEILVVADGLTVEVSMAAMWLKKKGIHVTAIVTDIPLIAETMGSSGGLHGMYSRLYGKKANDLLLRYDKYILLSEHMNEVVNPEKKKPFMLMECIVDERMFDDIEDATPLDRPAVMYAGKFYRECGVVELAKAASALKDVCDIWLYGGHGDCTDELEDLAKKNDNLKIHGIVPLKEILKLEKECTLLINPRFAEEEFSKYSFPSKTAEYMLSGTPVLMCKLPSLPEEYLPYVYVINGKEIANSIRTVLAKTNAELNSKGQEASLFIKNKKNKTYQAERIKIFIGC